MKNILVAFECQIGDKTTKKVNGDTAKNFGVSIKKIVIV